MSASDVLSRVDVQSLWPSRYMPSALAAHTPARYGHTKQKLSELLTREGRNAAVGRGRESSPCDAVRTCSYLQRTTVHSETSRRFFAPRLQPWRQRVHITYLRWCSCTPRHVPQPAVPATRMGLLAHGRAPEPLLGAKMQPTRLTPYLRTAQYSRRGTSTRRTSRRLSTGSTRAPPRFRTRRVVRPRGVHSRPRQVRVQGHIPARRGYALQLDPRRAPSRIPPSADH